MDLDGFDNTQKKERGGRSDPHGRTATDTTDGSNGSDLTDQTNGATWQTFKRHAYDEWTGGYGFGFALACMLAAFLARWLLDLYLNDVLPYATFILAVAIIALYCGMPATLIAVVLGGFLSNWFFVPPRYEFNFSGLQVRAEMAIYFTTCFATIGFIQTWRWAWRKTEAMAKDLHRQMSSKSSTKE